MQIQKTGEAEDLSELVDKTEIMREVLKSLKKEPYHLLEAICAEYDRNSQPVPDYHLHLSGYIGEVALKALLQAGLIKQQSGGRLSLYSYSPTEAGIRQYQKEKRMAKPE